MNGYTLLAILSGCATVALCAILAAAVIVSKHRQGK